MNKCPVCGYNGLDEPPFDDVGAPSYDICVCCGRQFGYHDSTKSHAALREEWIAKGMPWLLARRLRRLLKEWTADQIRSFQDYFDALMSGNLARQRQTKFMPADFKLIEAHQPPLMDQYDE